MSKFAFTTRIGLATDRPNVVGWCMSTADDSRRQWVEHPLARASAARIMIRGGYSYARQYVVENGKRVVLA